MSPFISGLPGFTFADLLRLEGLTKLDQEFLTRLKREHSERHTQLLAYRAGQVLPPLETSELLLACAPLIEEVIGDLFNIGTTLDQARARTLAHNPVFVFKKLFVQRRARRRLYGHQRDASQDRGHSRLRRGGRVVRLHLG